MFCLAWIPIKTELTWGAGLATLLPKLQPACVFAWLQLQWHMFFLAWIPIKTELTWSAGLAPLLPTLQSTCIFAW